MKARIKYIGEQEEMATNADSLYESGKNFAGFLVSTGGGKSFLSMDQIIKHGEKFNSENPLTQEDIDNGILSRIPVEYYSPTNIIIEQFQEHMIKHMIIPEYIEEFENQEVNIETIKNILRKINPDLKIENAPEHDSKKNLISAEMVNEYIENSKLNKSSNVFVSVIHNIVETFDDKQLATTVKRAMPEMQFATYKSLENKSAKQLKSNAVLRILDEAHRGGASKWWQKLQKLLINSKAHTLAITATPERDVDSKDMLKEIALLDGMGYTVKEVRNKKYLAGNIPLMDAIEKGLLSQPEVIHFNATLDETREFEDSLRKLVSAELEHYTTGSNSKKYYNVMNNLNDVKKQFKQILEIVLLDETYKYDTSLSENELQEKIKIDEKFVNKKCEEYMNLIADYVKVNRNIEKDELLKFAEESLRNLTMKDKDGNEVLWEELKNLRVSYIIKSVMDSNGLIQNSKAIAFINPMKNKKGEECEEEYDDSYEGKKSSEKEDYIKRVKEHLKSEVEKIKNRLKVFGNDIFPSIDVIHSIYKDSENTMKLVKFKKPFVNLKKESMRILASVNKFNEGFHPEGIRALFMSRPIAKNVTKGEPRIVLLQQIGRGFSATGKPAIIFDLVNNFMRNHEKFKGDAQKDCFAFLRLPEEQSKFYRLTHSLNKYKTSEQYQDRINVRKAIFSLKTLAKYSISIDYEAIPENMTLEDIISNIKDENLKENILDDLFLDGIELNEEMPYALGRDYKEARDLLLGLGKYKDKNKENDKDTDTDKTNSNNALKALEEIIKDEIAAKNGISSKKVEKEEVDSLIVSKMLELGLIDYKTKIGKEIFSSTYKGTRLVNEYGFIVRGILPQIALYNIYTGTKFDGPEDDIYKKDYYGMLESGRDVAGYDKDGFDENGIHRLTGRDFDERHFKKVDGVWKYEDPETGELSDYDPLGFNHNGIRSDGFDRNGYWHKKNSNGTYSIMKSRLNPEKKNVFGALFKGSAKLGSFGINSNCGEKLTNSSQFRSDGKTSCEINSLMLANYDAKTRKFFEEHPEKKEYYTEVHGRIVDAYGFDIRGFNAEGYNKDTSTKYDKYGKDVNGRMHPSIRRSQLIFENLKRKSGKVSVKDISKSLHMSPEEMSKAIADTMMFYRMSEEFIKDLDNAKFFNELNQNFALADAFFKLSPEEVEIERRCASAHNEMRKYFKTRRDMIIQHMQDAPGKGLKLGELQELERLKKKLENQRDSKGTHAVQYRENDDDDFLRD